jgi:hypothetical protein
MVENDTGGLEFRADGTARAFTVGPNVTEAGRRGTEGEWRQIGPNRIRQALRGQMEDPKRYGEGTYKIEDERLLIIHDSGGQTRYIRHRSSSPIIPLAAFVGALLLVAFYLWRRSGVRD